MAMMNGRRIPVRLLFQGCLCGINRMKKQATRKISFSARFLPPLAMRMLAINNRCSLTGLILQDSEEFGGGV
jgi:hypothetical protein